MDYWLQLGTNGFLYAIGIGVIGFFVKSVKKDIKCMLNWQTKICDQKFKGLEESDAFQWRAIDGHGHKGLDKEGSKVVRA